MKHYREKHDNHIFAILVHMAGNLMGLISMIMMTMSFSAHNKPAGEAFDLTKQFITKNLPLITTPGNIGLKFFEQTDAVFDFDKSVFYSAQ